MIMYFRVITFKSYVILIVIIYKISRSLDLPSGSQPCQASSAPCRWQKKSYRMFQPTWITENEHGCDQRGHKETPPFSVAQLRATPQPGLKPGGWVEQLQFLCLPAFRNYCIYFWLPALPFYYFFFSFFF